MWRGRNWPIVDRLLGGSVALIHARALARKSSTGSISCSVIPHPHPLIVVRSFVRMVPADGMLLERVGEELSQFRGLP